MDARKLTLASVLCSSLACSHAPAAKQPGAEQEGAEPTMEMRGDQVIRTYDLNKDGKPDDWKHFRLVPQPDGQNREQLLERELDTNFDGKVDLTTYFDDDGMRVKEIYDLDFDGKPDVINTYEHGVIIRKESFQTHREKPDATAFYEGGKEVRVERDTHGNGKIDTWEYYEGGKLARIGEDVDGDGLVDHWIKQKADDEDDSKPAADKPADKPAEKPAGAKPPAPTKA
jgi:hypothetical protein